MSLKFDPTWLLISDVNARYWAFYKVNDKEYNKILWDEAWKHANTIEPEDMHSDLLVRMHRSDFLTAFDPVKSTFGTFVTGRVIGYASHIIDAHLKVVHLNGSKDPDTGRRDTKKDRHQALCSEFNAISEEMEVDASPEILALCDNDFAFDATLIKDEELQQINRVLLPKEVKVFNLYYKDDYTLTEITKKTGMTDIYVRTALNKIKTKLRLLNDVKKYPIILRKRLYALIGICYPIMKAYFSEMSEGEKAVLKQRAEIINEMFVAQNGVYVLKSDIVLASRKEPLDKKATHTNGHSFAKKRALTEQEKKAIRRLFVSANGMIREDTSLKMKARVGKDVSVFQITGVIVGLHRMVSNGELALKNLKAYKNFIVNHRKKWATYQSAKYQAPKYQAALVV